MKTNSTEQLQQLLNNANAISQAVTAYKENYLNDSHCDKKGFGFNLDERFAACGPLSLRVDSWKGFYGASGCSNILHHVDQQIFNQHLLKVLQANFWKLIEETEKSIREEAATLKEKAKEELTKKIAEIDAL